MTDTSGVEIPKPKDWQAFQRGCVLLYRATLRDPNLTEYGRQGQLQNGIDLLGARGADPTKPVGIQCRRLKDASKLNLEALRKIASDAKVISPALTEIIVATTADEDVAIQAAAATVTSEIYASGWSCRIVVHGWQTLSLDIAQHSEALDFFLPISSAGLSRLGAQVESIEATVLAAGARNTELIMTRLQSLQESKYAASVDPALPPEGQAESPDLHAEISGYRELLKAGKGRTAINQLEAMLATRTKLPPYARYRIQANIAAAHFHSGQPDLALEHWKVAHRLRPADPKAEANVALGELATGAFKAAYDRALEVVRKDPSVTSAWSVLIQASDRSDTPPFDQLTAPHHLHDDAEIVAATIITLRRKDDIRWRDIAINAVAFHETEAFFLRSAAEAKLDRVLSSKSIMLGGIADPTVVSAAREGVDQLALLWQAEIDSETNEPQQLSTLACNLAAGFRFFGEVTEAARTIDQTIGKLGHSIELVRIRALLHLHAGEHEKVLEILKGQTDVELQMMAIEVGARSNPEASIERLRALKWTEQPASIARIAAEVALDLAILARNQGLFDQALAQIVAAQASTAMIELYRSRWRAANSGGPVAVDGKVIEDNDNEAHDIETDTDQDDIHAALLRAVHDEGASLPFPSRLQIALHLQAQNRYEGASNLLHDHVAVDRDTIGLQTYLETTVLAGLNARAQMALDDLPSELRQLPAYMQMQATLSWNVGDVARASPLIERLYQEAPKRLRFALWRMDALLRTTNNSSAARAVLDGILDDQMEGSLDEKIRLARALASFGFAERARLLAYRLYCLNRDSASAWMCLISAILSSGPSQSGDELLADVVTQQSAVRISRVGHSERRYVIESDEVLRKTERDAIPPDHSIAVAIMGKRTGDVANWPTGGEATLTEVKHKHLAAMHEAMERYEERFPSAGGLKQVRLVPGEPGGMDEMIRVSRERAEYIDQWSQMYAKGQASLPLFAAGTGADPVDAMYGLRELGVPYTVASGLLMEREAAFETIKFNAAKGCVVDAATLHLIRRLKLEAVITKVCGPIAVTQSTIDGLRIRQEKLSNPTLQPSGNIAYKDGGLVFTEVAPEALKSELDVIQSDLDWVLNNAAVLAAQPSQDGPPIFRKLERITRSRIFDDIYAASGAARLLLVDDHPTRTLAKEFGVGSSWLQPVLMIAQKRGLLAKRDYARALIELIVTGQTFISVDGDDLYEAAELDIEEAGHVGRRFSVVTGALGGRAADPESHARVASAFFARIWLPPYHTDRKAMTGRLLEALLRERTKDYRAVLNTVRRTTPALFELHAYMVEWARGHFISWPR